MPDYFVVYFLCSGGLLF